MKESSDMAKASARKVYENHAFACPAMGGGIDHLKKHLRDRLPEGSTVYVEKIARSGQSNVYALFAIVDGVHGPIIKSITAEVAYLLDLDVRPYVANSVIGGGIIGNKYDMDGEMILGALCQSLYGRGNEGNVYRRELAPLQMALLHI
jgi:hypothetical protein